MPGSRRPPLDRVQLLRMALTVLLLVALYIVFIALLVAVGLGVVPVAIIAVVVLLAQYFGAERLALAALGGYEMRRDEVPELHAVVEGLCAEAGVPMVRVGVVETAMPNAFTVGRSPACAIVCVSSGLLDLLDVEELAAILAHELTHVIDRSVMLMTLCSPFASAAAYLAALGRDLQARLRRRRGQDDAETPWLVVSILSGLVFLVSYALVQVLARGRELSADRGAAHITGGPDTVARALETIARALAPMSDRDLRGACGELAMFYVVGIELDASVATLCTTHPPLADRLDALTEPTDPYATLTASAE